MIIFIQYKRNILYISANAGAEQIWKMRVLHAKLKNGMPYAPAGSRSSTQRKTERHSALDRNRSACVFATYYIYRRKHSVLQFRFTKLNILPI